MESSGKVEGLGERSLRDEGFGEEEAERRFAVPWDLGDLEGSCELSDGEQ